MKTFHTLKIKTYPHKTLNSSKGVIKIKNSVLKRRNISRTKKPRCNWHKKNYHQKRIPNNTNTYILTFNSPTTPKEIKIGYINEKIETYIPNPLQCYECQKFGHHVSVCNGHTICGKCGEQEPNHTTIKCNLNNRCANCGEDHPSYTRSCPAWIKEKNFNHKNPEAWKIVEGSQNNPKTVKK